jgi:hypothetical protein
VSRNPHPSNQSYGFAINLAQPACSPRKQAAKSLVVKYD